MARILGDAASVLMKVLLRKSISMFDEFSCLFIDLGSLVWSTLRFSTIMARHASPAAAAAAASSSSASSASARRVVSMGCLELAHDLFDENLDMSLVFQVQHVCSS